MRQGFFRYSLKLSIPPWPHDGGIEASFTAIDLTDDKSVSNAAAAVEKQYGKIDILINDAALMQAGASVEEQDLDELRRVFNTNVIGTWSVTQKFLPLLKKSEHPRIVNVSSGAGSFEDPQYGLLHGTRKERPRSRLSPYRRTPKGCFPALKI